MIKKRASSPIPQHQLQLQNKLVIKINPNNQSNADEAPYLPEEFKENDSYESEDNNGYYSYDDEDEY